jgi:hypothetical protein
MVVAMAVQRLHTVVEATAVAGLHPMAVAVTLTEAAEAARTVVEVGLVAVAMSHPAAVVVDTAVVVGEAMAAIAKIQR